jgi:translation initiation factor 4G
VYQDPNIVPPAFIAPIATNSSATPAEEKAEKEEEQSSQKEPEGHQRDKKTKMVYVPKKKENVKEKEPQIETTQKAEKSEEQILTEKIKESIEIGKQEDKHEAETEKKEKQPEKIPETVYQITFLLQFKPKCQKKPKDMRPIEMPLKSNVNIDFSPYEHEPRSETAESVRNLRILLNKLAKDNFARIADTILNNFVYTKEILQEFARILFNKCVKEPKFIEVYMQLADQLFKKFKVTKDKPLPQGAERLSFRTEFLTQCQKNFENQEKEEEFLKEMPLDLDEEEKKQKKKQRLYGNMKLIGELFVRNYLEDNAVKECLDKLLKEIKEDDIENACHLLLTIGRKLYARFAFDEKKTTITKKPKLRLKVLNKEEFDNYIDLLISLRQADKVSSRLKFMIQDIVEVRDSDWTNAYDLFPVPQGKSQEGMSLRKKTKSIEKQENLIPPVPVPNKEGLAVTDPKIEQRELRKKSMNEQNVFGTSLDKYLKSNVDEKVRMRIDNDIVEYINSKSLKDLVESLGELSDSGMAAKHISIGHYIMWSFSQTEKDASTISQLIVTLKEQNAITQSDLESGYI